MPKIVAIARKAGGRRFAAGGRSGMRRATVRPSSWNKAARTFEFVLASEKPVRTWREDENGVQYAVDEVLSMAGITNLDAFVGSALLMEHDPNRHIGTIVSARVEDGEVPKLVAKARLSRRPDVSEIAVDIADGVKRAFSVRWNTLAETAPVARSGDVPLITITRLELVEGSLVSLPADTSCLIRSRRKGGSSRKSNEGARAMTPEELTALLTETFAGVTETLVAALTATDGEEGTDADLEAEAEAAAEEARAAVLAKKGGKKGAGESENGERSAADKAAIVGLRTACQKRGLLAEFTALEKAGGTLAELRGVLAAGLKTVRSEIDPTQRNGSGQKRGTLVGFKDTVRGKAAK